MSKQSGVKKNMCFFFIFQAQTNNPKKYYCYLGKEVIFFDKETHLLLSKDMTYISINLLLSSQIPAGSSANNMRMHKQGVTLDQIFFSS